MSRSGWIRSYGLWAGFNLGLAISFATVAPAHAWGADGHRIIADLARQYLSPKALAKVDALLKSDADALTASDMGSRASWADAWRTDHRETSKWHFANIELDGPDLKTACFGFPGSGGLASAGPADDCIVNKIAAFAKELADPATPHDEQVLALKYLLHFVGDLHQPLHASDNHDQGGNCFRVSLGGVRTTNLHSLWDSGLIKEMDKTPADLTRDLRASISASDKAKWEQGDAQAWALESFELARAVAYRPNFPSGCDRDRAPVALPAGYETAAKDVITRQLQKAGVRLALVLNRALGR